jgi:hypothetical protein
MIRKFNQYLKESEGTLTQEQKDWLVENTKGIWKVNPSTGLVDINGGFACSNLGLSNLKGVRFGIVDGDFDCYSNILTTLEGAPQEVNGSFYCFQNRLTSLVGSPRKVKDNFFCSNNKLTSLEGAPQEVGEDFYCYTNKITSLKGMPFVNGRIDLNPNPVWILISPYWEQIESMQAGSRNLVLQMIGRLENPTAEDMERIMRSVERMDMI